MWEKRKSMLSVFISSVWLNRARVVSAYRLSGGDYVRVSLNERRKRRFFAPFFPPSAPRLLDGSLLGGSGQTAHLLIRRLSLRSDIARPLIPTNEWGWRDWGLHDDGTEDLWVIVRHSVNMWEPIEPKDPHQRGGLSILLTYWRVEPRKEASIFNLLIIGTEHQLFALDKLNEKMNDGV